MHYLKQQIVRTLRIGTERISMNIIIRLTWQKMTVVEREEEVGAVPLLQWGSIGL